MKVEAKGLDKIQAQLLQMSKRAADVTPALKVGALDVKTTIVDAFRKSQDPATGEPWKALEPETVARRRRGSSKPLVDTGKLRGSIATAIGKDKMSRPAIFVGSTVPYAETHQKGSPTKNIPQRRFLPTVDGQFWGGAPGSAAAATAARVSQRVLNYLATGRATPDRKAPRGQR